MRTVIEREERLSSLLFMELKAKLSHIVCGMSSLQCDTVRAVFSKSLSSPVPDYEISGSVALEPILIK